MSSVMNKESVIELQKVDCNCNDCKYQMRDMGRFKSSLEQHHKWQLDYFNTLKNNLIKKAEWWQDKNNPKYNYEKGEAIKRESKKMRFQFNKKEASINFGICSKFDKKIRWIPNILQLETQDCFKHRRNKVNLKR